MSHLSDNFADPFNYSIFVAALNTNYSLFGNSSLEIDATHTNNITAALGNVFNVDCNAPSGYQNLSLTMKQVAPSSEPKSASLTLYSLNDTSFYTYDLTSSLNAATVNVWNNLTIPLGQKASGWTPTGTPSWGNITALQLSITYPANSNITIRIGALFFRGQYQYPSANRQLGLVEQFLSSYGFEFILIWFVLTGIIYLFFYGLENQPCLETAFRRHRLRLDRNGYQIIGQHSCRSHITNALLPLRHNTRSALQLLRSHNLRWSGKQPNNSVANHPEQHQLCHRRIRHRSFRNVRRLLRLAWRIIRNNQLEH